MADFFDVAGDLMAAMIRQTRNTEAGQFQRAIDPRMEHVDAWADRRKEQQIARRFQEQQQARELAEAQKRAQLKAQSSDDGIGLGGAALAGGALLALGALAYNALSSDDSSKSGNSSADVSTN